MNETKVPNITWTPILPPSSASLNGGPKPKRPLFVSIFMILGGIGFIGLLSLLVFVGVTQGAYAAGTATFTTLPLLVITLSIAIGGWKGTAYGWWGLGLYAVYSLSSGPVRILMTLALADHLEPPSLLKYLVRGIAGVFWGIVILIFIFRKSIREYFGRPSTSKVSELLILIALYVVFLFVIASQSLPLLMQLKS